MRYHSSLGPDKRKYTCWNGKFKYQNILNFQKNNFPEWTLFLAATKQLYQRSCPSICLSVCPSHFFYYVFIIISSWHFRSHYDCLIWCSCKGSRSEINGSKSQRSTTNFAPIWAFLYCNSFLNSWMTTEWCTKLEVAWKMCPIVFHMMKSSNGNIFHIIGLCANSPLTSVNNYALASYPQGLLSIFHMTISPCDWGHVLCWISDKLVQLMTCSLKHMAWGFSELIV